MTFLTSWNDYTTDCGIRPLQLENRGGDVYFIIHHAVNRVVQDTIALSKPGGKQVSMSFAIGPTTPGVEAPVYCVGVVPESRWPYTTASFLDKQALTVEVSNLDLGGSYPVAQAAKEWLAQIAAYMHTAYAMPLDRVHILSHQEVYARGYGSYATACPGGDLQASLDWIVNRAKQILTPPIRPNTEDEMAFKYIWDGGVKSALINPEVYPNGYIESVAAAPGGDIGFSGMATVPGPSGVGSPVQVNASTYTATLTRATEARAAYIATQQQIHGGGGGGGLTQAEHEKVIGSAQADKLAEVKDGVAAIPTTSPTYVPQSAG